MLARKGDASAGLVARGAARSRVDAAAFSARAQAARSRRLVGLERLALALAAHDPQRTLERGYALVEGPDGEPVTSAATARSLARMTVRLHDGAVLVCPKDAP